MIGKDAADYYAGKKGPRLSCAQAVAQAFSDRNPELKIVPADYAHASGGRAPEGHCGAVYAAMHLSEKLNLSKEQQIRDFFSHNAGSLKCRDIRSKNVMKCADCVENAARFLV